MNRRMLFYTFILITGLYSHVAHAMYFRLDGDRIWLQAERVPMQEILQEFARTGVEVKVDPSIRASITATYRGQDLDKALDAMFHSYDYVMEWRVLSGPLGQIPKLKSIQLFTPGRRSSARLLETESVRFGVTRGTSGEAEFVPDELLVGVKPGTTYEQFKRLLDQLGGMIVDVDATTGVYQIRFPSNSHVEEILRNLLNQDIIAHAELNTITRISPPEMQQAGRANLTELPNVKPPADGSTPVAVLDTGLSPSAGLDAVTYATLDATDPGRSLTDPEGHGTQMAMLAAGILTSTDSAAPTGETLPLVAIRTFDSDGKTSNFAILQALAYAQKAGANVVNMSWGSNQDSDFLRTALNQATANGILLVAAAGNQGTSATTYPAAYDSVLAVGGTIGGKAWSGSNYGSFVDLSAPAMAVFPIGYNGAAGTYVGTSISSANVANALALYRNLHPTATVAEAQAALIRSLSPAPGAGYGAGILDDAARARLLK